MERSSTKTMDAQARDDVFAGVAAGLLAGAVYLLGQMALAATQGGTGVEPLQRIAAMLLGEDAAPPGVANWTVIGMGLCIHATVSIAYGRLIERLVRRGTLHPLLVGAGVGGAMFVLHWLVIAPHAFPWFEQSTNVVTALDHVLFGLVAALGSVQLRRLFGRARGLPSHATPRA